MPEVILDDRGRLVLDKRLRDKFGDRFTIVEALGEIVLIPVPKDPLKTLQEEGKKLPSNMSVGDLKRLARDLAEEQAVKRLKEHNRHQKHIDKKRR